MLSAIFRQPSSAVILSSFFAALVSAAPTPFTIIKARYQPGSCGLHLTQYQKAVPGVDPYQVQINLFDAVQTEIGSTPVLPADPTVGVDSQLPYVVIVTVGNLDSDPVGFQYAGEIWISSDSQCSVGAYSGGSRQMDCGFGC